MIDARDKHFIKYQDLTSRDCYDFYRSWRRRKPKEIDQYRLFVKCVNGLTMLLAKMMEESEGGVYIQGLGYFCCVKLKNKVRLNKSKSLLLRLQKCDRYIPYFFPDKEMAGWTMSDSSCYLLRKKINATDIDYKLYFDTCLSYRIAEDFSTKSHWMKVANKEFNFKPNF